MMKSLCVTFWIICLAYTGAHGDRITLTTEESVAPPAAKLDWYVDLIDVNAKTLAVRYQWLDSTGAPVREWATWVCRDIEVSGANAECLGVANPHPCCTDVGAGTCDGLEDNCFSAIFRFAVRAQDVGTPIGIGLRALIWNQMRQDVLSGGNNGTFDE